MSFWVRIYSRCGIKMCWSYSPTNFSLICTLPLPASIPYHKSETLQPHLDRWFGRDEAVHHEGAQLKFRELHPEFAESFGSYDLVTFPADSSAVVLVRGTKTYFDYISDARLWYSSALFQVLREALPFGNFFAPLIRLSTNALSLLETSSIKQTAYYLETSRFIEDLKESGEYANIVITGHSLGKFIFYFNLLTISKAFALTKFLFGVVPPLMIWSNQEVELHLFLGEFRMTPSFYSITCSSN